MQHNIAKTIGRGWSPELVEATKLPERATRLERALEVAEKWMEDAREDSPELYSEAEHARDNIEEELSRVCFEMEVAERTRIYCEDPMGPDKDVRLMQPYVVSDGLIEAYVILRDAPENLLPPARRGWGRYELMGALMVAHDAATTEIERLEPGEATEESASA
jgi:hypothetical protein